jgi:hypothetical protein
VSEQGQTYAHFIEAELKMERDRRATYDARGQAVVTTSAALVTLLVALATLTRSAAPARFPHTAIAPLVASLAALTAAAALGILASWNFRYAAVRTTTLLAMVRAHWTDHEVDARNSVAAAQIVAVDSLRTTNNRKATLVASALVAQMTALVTLSAVVLLVILNS